MTGPVIAPGTASSQTGGRPQLRAATVDDVDTILQLIRELAEYEHLAHEVIADPARMRRDLFGARPAAEVILAEQDGAAVGFALFFHNYSTFVGKPGVYLEDLFVRPAQRGRGIGRRLFAEVARIAVARDCGRLEWAVLDWNTPARRFYEALGAEAKQEWLIHRLSGDALRLVAGPGTFDHTGAGP